MAFLGIYFGHLYGNPYLDGMASVAIGVILGLVAVFLVYESRGLIIGESADIEIVRSARRAFSARMRSRKRRAFRAPARCFPPHRPGR